MSLRPVQLTEDGTGERERARHVIGVDESGNPTDSSEAYAVTAVFCPRERGERLVELLVDCGLHPWQNKSRSLSAILDDPTEQTRRVTDFVTRLSSERMAWSAAFGWQHYSLEERAATACTVASRALAGVDELAGKAVLVHDGGENTYGSHQIVLRKQAAAKFNHSFQSTLCPVFVTSLVRADLIYPEVIAADYLAGYVRTLVERSAGTSRDLPANVGRIRREWREPETAPLSFYWLRTSGATHASTVESRVVAWIEGRRPARRGFESGGQYENVVSRLSSPDVRSYLRELA